MMRKRSSLAFLLVLACMAVYAQEDAFFSPYKSSALRLPSVPILVADPYFSFWSPYDTLTDGPLRHWDDAVKPIDGLLRVDGQVYRFMGDGSAERWEAVVPMADGCAWEAMLSRATPAAGWQTLDYVCDSLWCAGRGAFGTADMPYVSTPWTEEHSDLYVRRVFTLSKEALAGALYLIFSHDDAFELYLNGTLLVATGETWAEGVRLPLDSSLLHEGENIIATHTHNTTGGAYTDFGIYRDVSSSLAGVRYATQESVSVMATSTYYTFSCGPVALDLVFTAPQVLSDLDLLSAPVNFISYRVRSQDGFLHDVQLLLGVSPLLAVDKASQATLARREVRAGVPYLSCGTIEQPILAKKGDHLCIDWGYLYLPGINGQVALASGDDLLRSFATRGVLPAGEASVVTRTPSAAPTLAYMHNFGKVERGASFAMIGYDEVKDIEYMYKQYTAYWARDGQTTIYDLFERLAADYQSVMVACRAQDQQIYDDGYAVAGARYAELLAATYRHANAAHKLFEDDDGNILFFSKENDSNGCVNTVDLSYPSSPLYLTYNPLLAKGMITSILDYCLSGRWPYPFAAHDLGTYPKANGNVYGNPRRHDGSTMPLEESANILLLAAIITKLDGDLDYLRKYWDVLTTWNQYLIDNGKDPGEELCTDDFKGFSSRNANLAVKATMAIAAYAEMCKMLGDDTLYAQHMATARAYARYWVAHAATPRGTHYRMALDGSDDEWSLKYNMVWDKLWQWDLYNDGATGDVAAREIAFYLTKMNAYGVPLDGRDDTTKSDWVAWTAALADRRGDREKLLDAEYKYAHETATRWPLSDWHHTRQSHARGFRARSVIAGYWMPVFRSKLLNE